MRSPIVATIAQRETIKFLPEAIELHITPGEQRYFVHDVADEHARRPTTVFSAESLEEFRPLKDALDKAFADAEAVTT